MASRAVYSLHKSSTRDHVLSKAKEWGAEGRYIRSVFLLLQNTSKLWPLSVAGFLRSWDMTFLPLTSITRKPLLTFKSTLSDSPHAYLKPVWNKHSFLFSIFHELRPMSCTCSSLKKDSHIYRFCLRWFKFSNLSSRWAGRATLMTRYSYIPCSLFFFIFLG